MFSIKPIPPIPKEFRIIVLFYLAFLSLLIVFQTKPDGEEAVPAFTMPGANRDRSQSLYRFQDWQSEVDRRMTTYFKKEAVEVEETTWILREMNGTKPLRWSTTEFRIQWDGRRSIKEFALFQRGLDEKVAELGGNRLFADVCKINHVIYYRFDYGLHWGNQHLVTHRLLIKKPEHYTDHMGQLGFSVKARPKTVTPKPQLDVIGLTPKHQLLPTEQPRNIKKADSGAREVTGGLKRENALTATVTTSKQPRVAIIIDDFGFVKGPAEAYFQIRAPLTIAVLPGGEYSKEHALRAEQAGFEVLLHQPLEPLNMGRNHPGPGVISGLESEERIREEFASNLLEVPGAVGFNNHMGSAGTQDRRLMSILMSEAKRDGLFFIDSRAIANTVGEEVAQKAGVLHAGRRVFLDNDLGSIRKQLEMLKTIALRDGEAIAIAHARPGVAQAVEDYLPELERAGIRIVHVSELVHR